jgi:hypothetical protein
MSEHVPSTYIGQVERDPTGALWAVLYFREQVIERQPVRSLRHGKRLAANMVLATADAFPEDPRTPARVPLNRLSVERRASGRRRHLIPQLAAHR